MLHVGINFRQNRFKYIKWILSNHPKWFSELEILNISHFHIKSIFGCKCNNYRPMDLLVYLYFFLRSRCIWILLFMWFSICYGIIHITVYSYLCLNRSVGSKAESLVGEGGGSWRWRSSTDNSVHCRSKWRQWSSHRNSIPGLKMWQRSPLLPSTVCIHFFTFYHLENWKRDLTLKFFLYILIDDDDASNNSGNNDDDNNSDNNNYNNKNRIN
jgi:hypothetical protein